MANQLGKTWKKHRTLVITGGQIATILTLAGGLITTYLDNKSNSSSIQESNTWMKDSIKAQKQENENLKIENAVLKTEIGDLKWMVQIYSGVKTKERN